MRTTRSIESGNTGHLRNAARDPQCAAPWGIYVHVPFCAARCSYCDFNTYSGMDGHADAYFRAVRRELRAFLDSDGVRAYADTVFFGGGTPSYVDSAYIAGVLGLIPRGSTGGARDGADVGSSRVARTGVPFECTLEANPGTLSAAKLAAYRNAGVNRLSLGLQSTHETHLRLLGRIHSYGDFVEAVRGARNAGFENISADLIFGLPGQSIREWIQTLEQVTALGIRHVSCYSLSLEEGTRLYEAVRRGELPEPDEDDDREMYHLARARLADAGLLQYELSNFAEPGRECRHNLKYWTGERYRGIGAGASSYDTWRRYTNAPDIEAYAGLISGGISPKSDAAVAESEEIGAAEREKEFIILRLRLTRGFTDAEFRAVSGRGFCEKYAAEVDEFTATGLLESEPVPRNTAAVADVPPDTRFRLTARGMDLANQVFIRFI